ncbi:WhiB family transcriptional regulator [Corynebacterium sp. 13CS0277]|uniref:WhiB family transcriptional regulator n=1 Tax=Corynebacterium sp. 13CS0277 TaxID=2071994 RepID=UPI00351534DB
MAGALCASPDIPSELWDWQEPDEPSSLAEERYELAREVCAMCPVAQTCLQVAEGDPLASGIWGGKLFGPPRRR